MGGRQANRIQSINQQISSLVGGGAQTQIQPLTVSWNPMAKKVKCNLSKNLPLYYVNKCKMTQVIEIIKNVLRCKTDILGVTKVIQKLLFIFFNSCVVSLF